MDSIKEKDEGLKRRLLLRIENEKSKDFLKIRFTPQIIYFSEKMNKIERMEQMEAKIVPPISLISYDSVKGKIDDIFNFQYERIKDQRRGIKLKESFAPEKETFNIFEKIKEIGKEIYEDYFPDDLKTILIDKSISTIIFNSKEYYIPYELMYDEHNDKFLAIDIEFYRDFLIEGKKHDEVLSKDPPKIVFFTDPKNNLPNAETETKEIIELFQKYNDDFSSLIIEPYPQDEAKFEKLKEIFRSSRLDIFHYCGHSEITEEDIRFDLADRPYSVVNIKLKYPAIFFLNMCSSDKKIDQHIDFMGKITLNFPLEIIKRGAKACITTLWPIEDETAKLFAVSFYKQILEGKTFGTAIKYAKANLAETSPPEDITWLSFILYGTPDNATLNFKSEDLKILATLEEHLQKIGNITEIPRVKTLEEIGQGVQIVDGHILGLGLSGCGLMKVPEPIYDLKFIRTLDLSNNKISDLPETFGQLQSLEILNLTKNELTVCPEPILQLKSIHVLDLSQNQLKTLPESFATLHSLQELMLNNNLLRELPESIGELQKLQKLYLSGNQLTRLPESLGQLKSLHILLLDQNNLTTLPESFKQLQSLISLSLGGDSKKKNQFTELPDSIGELQKLQILNLNFNMLEMLPESIGDLQLLYTLNLYHNKLTTLPESIGELQSLRTLNLKQNELISLPKSFQRLLNLRSMNIKANNLNTQAKEILKNLKKDIKKKGGTLHIEIEPHVLYE